MVTADTQSGQDYLVRRISPSGTYPALLKFPSYFEIETINACNARCPMCTIDDWERGSKPMTDQLFAKLAAELSDHSDEVKRISLYRDGEPLLDKKLAGRIAILKDGGIKNVAIQADSFDLNQGVKYGDRRHTVGPRLSGPSYQSQWDIPSVVEVPFLFRDRDD